MRGKDHTVRDVAVIGAGPVGCYTAWSLARNGLDVMVLEKDREPKAVPVCTGIVGVEAFREFDLPLQSVLTRLQDVMLFSPSGRSIAYRPAAPQAYVVDRLAFDESLRRRALLEGVRFYHGCNCTRLEIEGDRVEIATSRRGVYRARTLVIASGYNPALTERLGLGRIPESLQGVQVDVRMSGLAATEVYVGKSVAPFSFAWVVPTNGTSARIGLVTRRGAARFLDRFLETPFLRGRVEERGRVAGKLMPRGQLDRSFAPRTIVVGEAAGQVKSTTYGGIYYGLIAARCAVETLLHAFEKGDFGMGAMGEYEDRWRHLLEREITLGFLLQAAFSALDDAQIERLFELVSHNGLLQALHDRALFDWHGGMVSYMMDHPDFRALHAKLGEMQ